MKDKHDIQRMEKQQRRIEAVRLARQLGNNSEAARRLGVARQTLIRWRNSFERGGEPALLSQGRCGPPRSLGEDELSRLSELLLDGPEARGWPNGLWTVERARELIARRFGARLSRAQAWRTLRHIGFSPQKPAKRARERDEDKLRQWKDSRWPELSRQAAEQKRTIVFVDESGLSLKPSARRTWAPVGRTPVIEFNFNWKSLSAIAGTTYGNFYFRLFEGAVKFEQAVEFLGRLKSRISGKLPAVWDGLSAHRSAQVRDDIASSEGRIEDERRPPAPRSSTLWSSCGRTLNSAA